MTSSSDIEAALANREWSDAEIITDQPRPAVVHSTRLPAEWSEALEAEASRHGLTPSRLMEYYIITGLQQDEADRAAR